MQRNVNFPTLAGQNGAVIYGMRAIRLAKGNARIARTICVMAARQNPRNGTFVNLNPIPPHPAVFIEMYQRLLNELEADEAVYFVGAVHPEYQTKSAYGWVKAGSNTAVQTTAGRGRVNIHGALNLETFDLSFVEIPYRGLARITTVVN